MLELRESKAGAQTQSEQDVCARQIHAVDELIDNLVYELYGLSRPDRFPNPCETCQVWRLIGR